VDEQVGAVDVLPDVRARFPAVAVLAERDERFASAASPATWDVISPKTKNVDRATGPPDPDSSSPPAAPSIQPASSPAPAAPAVADSSRRLVRSMRVYYFFRQS